MATASQIEVTQTLGKYALLEKLGEGYLGPVYRSFDHALGQAVVIRVLCAGIKWDSKIEELFNLECQCVSRLRHANIATIFEVGKDEQSPYVVMEALGNINLENVIAQKQVLSVEAKISIMIQVAEGMSHAHKNGVLHRDLNPGKIHVTTAGSVKIRDFAIAHVLKNYLPRPHVRYGAPIYLSPEQIQNRDCDERSDIFSAGVVFYELLTYVHPFHDPDSNKALDNILLEAEIPTFDQFPEAPPGIWSILNACLAKDPKDRYQNMQELSNACRDLLKEMSEDTHLMLAELQSSVSHLRKTAAQPDASGSAVMLLRDIQKLLSGDVEPDYVTLDRLMTSLSEQYPVIQEHACKPQILDPVRLQLFPDEQGIEPRESLPSSQSTIKTSKDSSSDQVEAKDSSPNARIQTPEVVDAPQISVADGVKSESQAAQVEKETEVTEVDKPPNKPVKPVVEPKAENPPAVWSSEGSAAYSKWHRGSPNTRSELLGAFDPAFLERYGRSAKSTYRSAACLLALLIIIVSAYIFLNASAAAPLRSKLNTEISKWTTGITALAHPGSGIPVNGTAAEDPDSIQEKADTSTPAILLKEARVLADMGRNEESKILLRRILELDPAYEPALQALREIKVSSLGSDYLNETKKLLNKRIEQISAMIYSHQLQAAKIELNELQQDYPWSAEIIALRKQWQTANARETEDLASREEEERKATQQKKEDQWDRKATELFARGNYSEANRVLGLWLGEFPGSSRPAEFGAKMEELRRGIKTLTSALAEKRYQDALNALNAVERINPTDPNLGDLRKQIEANKATARATLTIHRLGSVATILLDGKPVGSDGEVISEKVSIGNHTLAIANDVGVVASKSQEFLEGQGVSFVYDLAKQNLRAMKEGDRGLIAQRKTMEEVYRFALEHTHSVFRGICRGELLLSYYDIVYRPTSGSHGFRMPVKTLNARVDGKVIDFVYISDDKAFQSFRFQDEETALRFRQIWEQLRTIARQSTE